MRFGPGQYIPHNSPWIVRGQKSVFMPNGLPICAIQCSPCIDIRVKPSPESVLEFDQSLHHLLQTHPCVSVMEKHHHQATR